MKKGGIRTITDLAKIAGVSAATVSRVLNNSGYVGKKTRQKVQNVIKAHNFLPNLAARSLATSKTYLIGLIIPNFDNPVYLEVLKGVNFAAIERGYSVVLSQCGEEPESIRESMLHLAALKVDGIIATHPEVHDIDLTQYLTTFIAERVPIARLGDADQKWKVDGVAADSFESGRLAADHLARLGHDRIGVLGVAVNSHVKRRVEGIKAALLENGRSPKNIIQYDADFTQSGGYRAALSALKQPDRPNAYLALNDVMAIGALMAAEDFGLHVPKDAAIVGIDGIHLGLLVRPRLSTVVLPTFEMGKKLFELIHSRLTGEYSGEAREIVFHSRLVARESSMPIRHVQGE
jgi:DNA-binding LacI/PurR family transcriptional regulator